jgi:hypothetical protein
VIHFHATIPVFHKTGYILNWYIFKNMFMVYFVTLPIMQITRCDNVISRIALLDKKLFICAAAAFKILSLRSYSLCEMIVPLLEVLKIVF